MIQKNSKIENSMFLGSVDLSNVTPAAPRIATGNVTMVDLFNAADKSAQTLDNVSARSLASDEAIEEHNRQIFAVTGEKLFNPHRQHWSSGIIAEDTAEPELRNQNTWEMYRQRLAELAEKYPDQRQIIQPNRDPRAAANLYGRKAEQDLMRLRAQYGDDWWSSIKANAAMFAGGIAAMRLDPANIAASTVGFNAARVGTKGLLVAATKNAAVNAGVQVAQEPFVQFQRGEAGAASGWEHSAFNVAAAAVFGGALDLGVRATARGVRAARGQVANTDEKGYITGWRPAGEAEPPKPIKIKAETLQKALDGDLGAMKIATRELGIDQEPEIRALTEAADIDAELAAKMRENGIDDGTNMRNLAQAIRAATDDEEPPPVQAEDRMLYALERRVERLEKHGIDEENAFGDAIASQSMNPDKPVRYRGRERYVVTEKGEGHNSHRSHRLIKKGNQIVARATIYEVDGNVQIGRIDTVPKMRQRGIGRMLVEGILNEFEGQQVRTSARTKLGTELFKRYDDGDGNLVLPGSLGAADGTPSRFRRLVDRFVPAWMGRDRFIARLEAENPKTASEARRLVGHELQRDAHETTQNTLLGARTRFIDDPERVKRIDDAAGPEARAQIEELEANVELPVEDVADAVVKAFAERTTGTGADFFQAWRDFTTSLEKTTFEIADKTGAKLKVVREKANVGKLFYRVFDGRKQVGEFYVAMNGYQPDAISVTRAGVDDAYQRRGIASQVYDLIEKDAQSAGGRLVPQGDIHMSPDAVAFWNNRTGGDGQIYALRAMHASPFIFDKFDISKLGTGEGQYLPELIGEGGRGHYFTTSETRVVKYHEDITDGRGEGAIYDVRIEADENQLLDLDVEIFDQPPHIQAMLEALGIKTDADMLALPRHEAGQDAMAKAGLKGVAYTEFDGNMQGHQNYVIYDDDAIVITHRDGEPVGDDQRAYLLAERQTAFNHATAVRRLVRDGVGSLGYPDQIAQTDLLRGLEPTLRREIMDIVERMPEGYGFMLAMRLRAPEGMDIDGVTDHLAKTVKVALASQDPARVARHEEIHVLRELGLIRDDEWDALTRHARKNDLRKKYDIDGRYAEIYGKKFANDPNRVEQMLIEETIAEMWADRVGAGTSFGERIDRLIDSVVELLNEISKALNMKGVQRINQVYRRIETGQVGRRRLTDVRISRETGEVYAIAGEKAVSANREALAAAKKLETEGASREDIWDTTGWWRGPDSNWRFEIDDSLVRERTHKEMRAMRRQIEADPDALSTHIDHQGLEEAYPSLYEDTDLYVRDLSEHGADGLFWKFGTIELDKAMRRQSKHRISVLMHEVQHAIQEAEGFARGGSTRSVVTERKMTGIQAKRFYQAGELRAAARRLDMTVDEYIAFRRQLANDADDPYPFNDLMGKDYDPKSFELANDEFRFAELNDRYDRSNPWTVYERLAGEAESRLVQRRMHMTPEERADRPPWLDYDVDEDKQIVHFDGEAGKSARSEHVGQVVEVCKL